ncbi:hypothetical protein JQX13_24525 [Archangium violaceum]|uniref:ADYC domain-containing protein n=1 Tax=Archangium violaceum TaxID=83451 RepID=UPI00193BB869|nr:ADYC domain-containing protein [Archangium violaceum]QRK12916.1 hypothetical protein JQX13_24525 [Archangium violaceum]
MRSNSTFPGLLGALLLSACAGPIEAENDSEAELAIIANPLLAENGGNLNGGNLNGGNLNGNDLSNFVVSVNFNPSRKGNHELDTVWLQGTTFYGYDGQEDGRIIRDTDFIGVEFQGNLGDGGTVRMRITGMNAAPAPNADLKLYSVQYFDAKDYTWKPACRDAAGTVVQAIPVQGVWNYLQDVPGGGSKYSDPERFTFACLGGAIAKCTLFGYRPWASYNGTPLEPYHQACTRLVRADYCGSGRSFTVAGNRINLYDPLGIQQDTEEWMFEAAWDVNGARCFYALNRTHSELPCFNSRQDLLCGVDLGSNSLGVLLRNETPGTLGMDPGN